VMTTTHKTLNGPRGALIFFRKELESKINRSVFPGIQGGPHNNIIAAIALALKNTQTDQFKQKQNQIVKNAKALASKLIDLGFHLITGGTDTHLILIDLRNKGISGHDAQDLLENAGIMANRNSIPDDSSPFYPSGIRMGTPAVTFRGMAESEVEEIAIFIDRVLTKKENPEQIKQEVKELCQKFPIPYDY